MGGAREDIRRKKRCQLLVIIIGAGDPNVGGELSGLDFVLTLRESSDVTCALVVVGGACAAICTPPCSIIAEKLPDGNPFI